MPQYGKKDESFRPHPATLLKKRLWHRCFSVNFCEISKKTFCYRTHPVTASIPPLNTEIAFKPSNNLPTILSKKSPSP